MKVTHRPASPKIDIIKDLVPEQYILSDVRLKYKASKINTGLNPGVVIAGYRVREPKIIRSIRSLRITSLLITLL
jgi:hypothetical protein